jgi:2-amino-4-hydroxy-6-hydroxymethyldihydropteridine diphosphokinase
VRPARAGIALGSNLGDRLNMLQKARDQILHIDGNCLPVLQSAIYETSPVDCEPGAQNFYNAVIEIGFKGSADALLTHLRQIELALGREHEHRRNVSRTVDLDLLYFDDLQCNQAHLRLPHPRIADRAFVLRPLADIASNLRLPGHKATVPELLVNLRSDESMKRVADKW